MWHFKAQTVGPEADMNFDKLVTKILNTLVRATSSTPLSRVFMNIT